MKKYYNLRIANIDSLHSLSSKSCKVHVMPPSISDADINSLFGGIINIMRHKLELEAKAEIINISIDYDRLLKELHEKKAECNRLKNEIIYLKSQLKA